MDSIMIVIAVGFLTVLLYATLLIHSLSNENKTLRKQRDNLGKQLAAFDHDGDGKAGGSRKR